MVSSFATPVFTNMPTINGLELATYSLEGPYHPRDNLLVAHFPKEATLAGVTTQSSVVGAPVTLARKRIPNGKIHALIVNAGNANVCTGVVGKEHTHLITSKLAQQLNCKKEHTLMASTGVIGEKLNPDIFLDSFCRLQFTAKNNWSKAASAIMTTDTYPKAHFETLDIGNQTYSICGIAKGSGMIAPNMATMLAFVFTDLPLSAQILQTFLDQACPITFNAISVDGDTSTSDMVLAMATGKTLSLPEQHHPRVYSAFHQVCQQLALSIVKDGEGISKLIKIEIENAENKKYAKCFAQSIANSPLVKTAIYGEDLNWGRIVMALGKTSLPIDMEQLTISFGHLPIYKKGQILYGNAEACENHLKEKEVSITVDLSQRDVTGKGHAFVFYSSDLTHEYIRINTDYRS